MISSTPYSPESESSYRSRSSPRDIGLFSHDRIFAATAFFHTRLRACEIIHSLNATVKILPATIGACTDRTYQFASYAARQLVPPFASTVIVCSVLRWRTLL